MALLTVWVPSVNALLLELAIWLGKCAPISAIALLSWLPLWDTSSFLEGQWKPPLLWLASQLAAAVLN